MICHKCNKDYNKNELFTNGICQYCMGNSIGDSIYKALDSRSTIDIEENTSTLLKENLKNEN